MFVRSDSGLLPEMLYVVEKSTQLEYLNTAIYLSRFQKQICREPVDSLQVRTYETQFFEIDQDLSFPEKEPALKKRLSSSSRLSG